MSRILVFIVVVGGFALSTWSSPETVGAQLSCANSGCLVRAGSSPTALIVALALLGFLFAYPQRAFQPNDQKIVGVLRRFGAFFLDFAAIMVVAGPIGAIPTLFAEYLYTGSPKWSFERNFERPTDTLLILPVVLGIFIAMFLYFYLHPKRGRQTLGQYILGFRVTAGRSSTRPLFGKRTLLSFIGLCAWPVSVILAMRNEQKSFWWDAASNTQVVHAGS